MIFNWFDTREEIAFADELAGFVAERIPTRSPKKAPEALDKLFARVARFRQERKLNMYRKAKLANAFRWKLVDLGYADEFADELTREVLLRL